MDDVFVVVAGHYSDQSIECVFTTEEAAKAYCDEMNRRDGGTPYYPDEAKYWFIRADTDPPLPSVVEAVVEPDPGPPNRTPEGEAERTRLLKLWREQELERRRSSGD